MLGGQKQIQLQFRDEADALLSVSKPRRRRGEVEQQYISSSTEEHTNEKCYLLELPRELRDIIVEEAIKIEYDTAYLCYTSRRHVVQPSLARTNRHLRAESVPVFYSSKAFGIASIYMEGQWETARRWFTAVQPYLHMIKKIEIELCSEHARVLELYAAPDQKPTFKLKKYCQGQEAHISHIRAIAGSLVAVVGCEFDILFKGLKDQLQFLCNSVGTKGFGSEAYVRAAELFLFPMKKRCTADYPDSDLEDDSD